MRIAIFVDAFPVLSETFILRQISGLLDLGHDVHVYSARTPPDGPVHPDVARHSLLTRTTYLDQRLPAESGIWEMPVWPLTGKTWLPGAERPVRNVWRVLRSAPALVRCLVAAPGATLEVLDSREYGYQARSLSALHRLDALRAARGAYDVLHAHFGPTASTFRFARRLCDAPLLVSFHGYDYTSVPRQHGPGAYSPLFRSVDAVLVNSTYAGGVLRELGCPPGKLYRLNYGIDLSAFAFRARHLEAGEPIRVLTVARLVEKKGLTDSIRAFACARMRSPNARYDIIGDGPMRPQLARLIEELGMSKAIALHGALDEAAVRRAMDLAHVFVLASVTAQDGDQEGTPVSLLEAQAMGLPVISTWHSGIPEIVADGRAGYLVRERDIAMLTERLLQLFAEHDAWPRMGGEGRRHVEDHHDLRRLNEDLVQLYDRLATARGGH